MATIENPEPLQNLTGEGYNFLGLEVRKVDS